MPAITGKPWTGVYPIAPTPFADNGDLDLPGMRRVLDCMIDQGVDGICILANYSEQFLLTDEERDTLLDLCLTHVAGRVPVIVTCSHYSTRIASARAKRAAEAGAKMLMLMPPYHGALLRADEKGIVEHFAAVAKAANGIPLMVQDALLSGTNLSVPLLVRLAREVPQVSYFKIEVPNAAAKLRALIEARQSFWGFMARQPAWQTPEHPYRVAVEIRSAQTGAVVLGRVSFQSDRLPQTPYLVHYAPGTVQNGSMAECLALPPGSRCRGTYWFRPFSRFTQEYWNTRRVRDGAYRVTVYVWDIAGNKTSRTVRVEVANL